MTPSSIVRLTTPRLSCDPSLQRKNVPSTTYIFDSRSGQAWDTEERESRANVSVRGLTTDLSIYDKPERSAKDLGMLLVSYATETGN